MQDKYLMNIALKIRSSACEKWMQTSGGVARELLAFKDLLMVFLFRRTSEECSQCLKVGPFRAHKLSFIGRIISRLMNIASSIKNISQRTLEETSESGKKWKLSNNRFDPMVYLYFTTPSIQRFFLVGSTICDLIAVPYDEIIDLFMVFIVSRRSLSDYTITILDIPVALT